MNGKRFAVVISLIPLAGIAGAESGTFESYDANKDGRISMPEAATDPKLVENFSTVDKNGDGYLDKAEFDAQTEQPQR